MTPSGKTYHIGSYTILAVIFLSLHYLLQSTAFDEWSAYRPFAEKLTLSLTLIMIVLLIGRLFERLILQRAETEGSRHNLFRINRLLTAVCLMIIVASFLFQNLYAVAVSFGLISLVLGFALQAPITSFIAWLYIIFRRPYSVGDRIEIDGQKGDVIEISYLDTTIEEFSGIYLGNDRKSGRIVYFPNSLILKSQVINYSGRYAPFIWNETALQISYTSDLSFIENCLKNACKQDFELQYPQRQSDENKASVYFRVNKYAWLEAVVTYPVEPTDTTGRRNRILSIALPALNARPDLVGFPEGSAR